MGNMLLTALELEGVQGGEGGAVDVRLDISVVSNPVLAFPGDAVEGRLEVKPLLFKDPLLGNANEEM